MAALSFRGILENPFHSGHTPNPTKHVAVAQMKSFSRLKVNSGKTAVYHRDKAGKANDTAMILGPCIRMELKCHAMCSAAPSLAKKFLSDSKSATVQLYLEENNHVQRKTINTVVVCQGDGKNPNKFLSS